DVRTSPSPGSIVPVRTYRFNPLRASLTCARLASPTLCAAASCAALWRNLPRTPPLAPFILPAHGAAAHLILPSVLHFRRIVTSPSCHASKRLRLSARTPHATHRRTPERRSLAYTMNTISAPGRSSPAVVPRYTARAAHDPHSGYTHTRSSP